LPDNFDSDLAFAIQVVRALWEGHFLDFFEVQDVECVDAEWVYNRLTCLRRLDEMEAGATPCGINAMVLDLGLIGVPWNTPKNERQQALERQIGRSMTEVYALQDRIGETYPSRFGVLIGLRTTDPRRVRVVNYDTPYGSGWYGEVLHDGQWLRPYDAPEFADHPDRDWLSGTLGKGDEDLKKSGPMIRSFLEAPARNQRIRQLLGY
jgi:hypothetical protein